MAASTATATLTFAITTTTTLSGPLGSAFNGALDSHCAAAPAFLPNISPKLDGGFTAGPQGPGSRGSLVETKITGAGAANSITNTVPFSCIYTLVVAYSNISGTIDSETSSTSSITTVTTKTSKTLATPTSTASIDSAHADSSDGVTPTVIGLAVGLGLAGAVLLSIAACFLLKRCRRGKQDTQGKFNSGAGSGRDLIPPSPGPIFASMKKIAPASGPSAGSGAVVAARRGATINIDRNLDLYLLDGAGDSDISRDRTTLNYLLKDYVETSYHAPQAIGQYHVSSSLLVESLSNLGLPEPTKLQIATLALGERTRSNAIRSLLAFVIFSALDIQSSNPSLLPLVVANFRRAVSYDTSGSAPSQHSKAMNTWRRTSAYLLHPNKQDRSPLPLPPGHFESQINSLQDALQDFLQYFTDTRSAKNNMEHTRGLEKVIRACATLGYALFSHPCEWRYLYETEDTSGSQRLTELVVMPGLERVTGSDGEGYKSRQVVCVPATEKV